MKEPEKRSLRSATLGVNKDEEMIIEGYALKFNEWSNDLGGFIELITPEALKNTDLSDVRCLIDHDPSKIIGRTVSETLQLTVDDEGLFFRCELPDTTYSKDAYENIRLGNISNCSFGFYLAPGGEKLRKNPQTGIIERTITAISSIFDVSVVTYPAYDASSVELVQRSMQKIQESEKEKFLFLLELEKYQ